MTRWWRCCSAGSGWPGLGGAAGFGRSAVLVWFLRCRWPPPGAGGAAAGPAQTVSAWPCAAFSIIPSSWTALCSRWSLINTFGDLRRVNLWRLLRSIRFSCGAYFASYAVLGQAIIACGGAGGSFGLVEVVQHAVRRPRAWMATSLGVAGSLGLSDAARGLVARFTPPAGGYVLRHLFAGTSARRLKRCSGADRQPGSRAGKLPEPAAPGGPAGPRRIPQPSISSLRTKPMWPRFIEINQNIIILQD